MGNSTVIWCSRYANGGWMYVILNGKLVEEVDCFKYLGSQMAVDGGCESRKGWGVQNESVGVWRPSNLLLEFKDVLIEDPFMYLFLIYSPAISLKIKFFQEKFKIIVANKNLWHLWKRY